ncbi:MAG: hypothetical protein KAT78_00180 [Flavobacteriaceae bacterium]|nr:hypothetical protein [Flavobacteriaceae bacterium]
MNLIEFSNNLKDPRSTSIEQTIDLENIIEKFPYFHAAHFLHLNGLKNQNSFKYNNYLKKTAAYTSDRSILFDFITSYDFNFQPNLEEKEIIPNKNIENKKSSKVEVVENKAEENIQEIVKTTTLKIGKPLQFDNTETYSFSEWLQITSVKPIQRKKAVKKEVSQPKSNKSNFDLINNFISLKPKIKPVLSNLGNNIAVDSVTENKSLMTETLAHVYLEQKKYQKAITAFTVLSLKYPEKSGFFANQIKAIKTLQEK